jgi:transposase-like protein
MQRSHTTTAITVHAFGRRHVLGVSMKVSETEIHRRAFLESLVARILGLGE